VIYFSEADILRSDMEPKDTSSTNTETPLIQADQSTKPVTEDISEPQPTVQASLEPASDTPRPAEPSEKKEGGIISLFVTIIVALIIVQVVNLYFLQSYRVYGSSMYSTLQNSDRLIISKFGRTLTRLSHKKYQPNRADIIVFISPIDPNIQLVKRVIGLPGERVVVAGGRITVYNQEHPEGFNPDDAPYGKNLPVTSGNVDVRVPAGHIFVSGDNREGSNSLDSRNELGTVPEENILGTLVVRIWPLGDARFF